MPRQFLAEFFGRHYAPTLERVATLIDYQGTVRLFCRLIGDVAIGRIDAELVETFRDRAAVKPRRQQQLLLPFDEPVQGDQLLLFDPVAKSRRDALDRARGRRTLNKHLRNLRAIVRKWWRMQGRLQEAPDFGPIFLREDRCLARDVTDDELGAIYRAAAFARHPDLPDVRPVDWWQAFIAVAVTTGFRRRALMALPWRRVDLARRQVTLPSTLDKAHRERCKPLNLIAVQHLMRLRGDRELVFPWPASRRTLDRQWHRMQSLAGLPSYDHIRIHDLKAVCGSRLAEAGASLFATMQQMDHANVATTQRYMTVPREQREAVEAMRLPACFYGASADQAFGG